MTATAHTHAEAALAVRPATAADADALRDLARLDSARPLTGPVLVGELDGAPVAARSLHDGRVVADPFVRTSAVRDLLGAYAARLMPASAVRRSLWSLAPQRRHVNASA